MIYKKWAGPVACERAAEPRGEILSPIRYSFTMDFNKQPCNTTTEHHQYVAYGPFTLILEYCTVYGLSST